MIHSKSRGLRDVKIFYKVQSVSLKKVKAESYSGTVYSEEQLLRTLSSSFWRISCFS